MTDLVVIFRTHSDIEAQIVRGLLETHGVMSVVSSDVPHSIFSLSVDGLSEVRIAVHPGEADDAQRIIEAHRTELKNGQVVRLRDEFETLQQAIGYRFRDRGLLEHAMTHTSRANEDVSGGVVDNESMEFLGDAVLGFVVADMLFREFPQFDEGQKSKIKASLVSTATLARQAERLQPGRSSAARPRRGEDRRAPQAGAAGRRLRGADRGDLSRRRHRARARVHRPRVRRLLDEVRRDGVTGQDYKSALQELLQSRDLPLPEYRLVGTAGPDHRKLFEIEVGVRGEPLASATGASKKEAEQEAALRARET